MALSIIVGPNAGPDSTTFLPDLHQGTVIVESNAPGPPFQKAWDELQSTQARTYALQYASQVGCSPALQNGNIVGPYPVNRAGVPLDQVMGQNNEPLPADHPDMQVGRYRVAIKVSRKGG